MVALWLSGLWRLQADTLGLSPAVAGFWLLSFLPEQVEFHLNIRTGNEMIVKIITSCYLEMLKHMLK